MKKKAGAKKPAKAAKPARAATSKTRKSPAGKKSVSKAKPAKTAKPSNGKAAKQASGSNGAKNAKNTNGNGSTGSVGSPTTRVKDADLSVAGQIYQRGKLVPGVLHIDTQTGKVVRVAKSTALEQHHRRKTSPRDPPPRLSAA